MRPIIIQSSSTNIKTSTENIEKSYENEPMLVGSIEDFDIDSVVPPLTINLQGGGGLSSDHYTTVFIERDNCVDIKSTIDQLKDKLENTIKDLINFKENYDQLQSTDQFKQWSDLITNIKEKTLNNSNIYLTIPTTLILNNNNNINNNNNNDDSDTTSTTIINDNDNNNNTTSTEIKQDNNENNNNIISPDSLKIEAEKETETEKDKEIEKSLSNSSSDNSSNTIISTDKNKGFILKKQQKQEQEEEDDDDGEGNIAITNYTQGPSMLSMMKKKFDKIKSNSSNNLNSSNNNNNNNNNNISPSSSPPSPLNNSKDNRDKDNKDKDNEDNKDNSTNIGFSMSLTNPNPLSVSKRMNKLKSWTSSKPSSSSIGFGTSLQSGKSFVQAAGGSRFFTSRQDSMKLDKQISTSPSSQSNSPQSPSPSPSPSSLPSSTSISEDLNNNNNNNNKELIIIEKEKIEEQKEEKEIKEQQDEKDEENLKESNSLKELLEKEKLENEEKENILKQRQENDILKKKQHLSKGYFMRTCNSSYDDGLEEEDILVLEDHWETNVIVLLPCRHHVKVPGSSSSSIESIRQLAWASGNMQGHLNLEKEEKYFTLRWCNKDVVFDQDTPLSHLIQYNLNYNNPTSKSTNIKLELVLEDEICKERLVDLQSIEINNGKPSIWKSHIDDVLIFNKKLRELAMLAKPQSQTPSARLTPYPPPKTIPEFFVIRIHVKNQTKSLRCSNNHTAFSLMTILSDKVKNTMPFNPLEHRFLITGINQYVDPNVPLLSVEYILEKIKRKGEIDLTMVELSNLGLINSSNSSNSLNSSNSSNVNNNQLPKHQQEHQQDQKKQNNGILKILSDIEKPIRDLNTSVTSISLTENLQVRLLHAHEIFASKASEIIGSDSSSIQLFIEAAVYFGGELLATQNSKFVSFQDTVVWNEWINVPLPVSNIPKGARICLGLNAKYRGDIYNIGWVGHRLFDSKGILNTFAPLSLLLWPGKINPIGTCVDNLESKDQAIIIAFEFKDYVVPKTIYYEDDLIGLLSDQDEQLVPPSVTMEEMDKVEQIILQDPLYSLSKEEKLLIWKSRYFCQTKPQALSKLLQSVEWTDYKQVGEAFQLLKIWPILPAIDALELLDPKFADCVEIREYAVKCLDQMSDYELEIYMLQLVQAIKHDVFHGSVLSLFLIGRVWQNIQVLGHPFFWHLRADIDNQEVCERFRVLCAGYLRYAPPQLMDSFKREISTLRTLENLAKRVKEVPYEKRRQYVENHLREEQSFPSDLLVPFDPSIKILNVIPEKCKSMDSAKVPLWVTFKNADPFAPPLQMIVKTGDDLRQDILTLQLLRLMDHMWKSQDLDLHMTIYRCIATGLGTGLIEVVPNSETAARIQAGAGGASGAFKQTPIANWLKNHNQTENAYQKAVSKFTLSCAGYCVATYVLGIGDRHNDNIMIDNHGHLFHIDFGHFLGNFKTFAGFQREKAPFVLTPDFVYVIGGKESPNFAFFVDICCKAFNIVRNNAHLFINMFELMLSTGIPELKSESDIFYLRDKFRLDLTDIEAADYFKKLIHESIGTFMTRLNFAVHIFVHNSSLTS